MLTLQRLQKSNPAIEQFLENIIECPVKSLTKSGTFQKLKAAYEELKNERRSRNLEVDLDNVKSD